MRRKRSYTENKNHPFYPSIGKLLSEILVKKRISKLELAQRMGISHNSVANYLKQPSLQLGIIWNISFALKYDILSEIIDSYPRDFPLNKNTKLMKELQEKDNKIKELEKEIEIYTKFLKQK